MTPGVTGVGGGGVNTAGQLNRNNSYLVDGVSNDDTIVSSSRGGFSLEAVREYIVKSDLHPTGQHSLSMRYRLDHNQTHGDGIGGLSTHDRAATR